MRGLFLIIERGCRFFIQVPGQAADDDVDVAIGVGVGLESIPATNQTKREGRLVVDQLEGFDGCESGDQTTSAVDLDARSSNGVRSRLPRILSGIPLRAGRESRIPHAHEHARSRSRQRRSDRTDLARSAVYEGAGNGADVRPAAQSKCLDDLVFGAAEWSQSQTRRVILEPIGFTRGVTRPVDDGGVDLSELVREADRACNSRVRRSEEAGTFYGGLGNPPRPERLDVIDHLVVQKTAANVGVPAGTLDKVVLEIRVLGADHPPSVERIVRGRLLLEHVSSDANAGALTGRHSEGEIGALHVEVVGCFRRASGTTGLEIGVQNSGNI